MKNFFISISTLSCLIIAGSMVHAGKQPQQKHQEALTTEQSRVEEQCQKVKGTASGGMVGGLPVGKAGIEFGFGGRTKGGVNWGIKGACLKTPSGLNEIDEEIDPTSPMEIPE